ncbi:MAG: glutamine-dependent NAD(+) synthetase [Lichina confinis]|nr:MAG: glutamine-dependent NAD(+) synthetase [Lichina confinis]
MAKQSSKETRQRAKDLSEVISSYHVNLDIDDVYNAQRNLVIKHLEYEPKFKTEGGTLAESLMLQNIQARSRMVTAYEFAQMLPTTRKRLGGGSLLVLGSANVGEALRGYFTKYDCSSADINPIGSISKSDLRKFIAWAETEFKLPVLREFLDAVPTAELEPITKEYVQSDEVDMGMTYDELSTFGILRKVHKLGPFSMFQRLVHDWSHLSPRQVAEKVKRFYHYYAINRHKMTTLTPALHSNDYSPDDNRFDHRPFLYPAMYRSWPFKRIDEEVEQMEKQMKEPGASSS